MEIIEGYKVNRNLMDRDCFSSNQEIRFKMKVTKNAVTRNSYKHILINRALSAIQNQLYFAKPLLNRSH